MRWLGPGVRLTQDGRVVRRTTTPTPPQPPILLIHELKRRKTRRKKRKRKRKIKNLLGPLVVPGKSPPRQLLLARSPNWSSNRVTRPRLLLLLLLLPHQHQHLQLLRQLRQLRQLVLPILVLPHKRFLPLLNPHLHRHTSQARSRPLSIPSRTSTHRGRNHNLHLSSQPRQLQRPRQLPRVRVVEISTRSAQHLRTLHQLQLTALLRLFRRGTVIVQVLRRRFPASSTRHPNHNPHIIITHAPPPIMSLPSPRPCRLPWPIHLHILR